MYTMQGKNQKYEKRLNMRLSEEDFNQIRADAARHHMNVSVYVRYKIFTKRGE